MNISKLILPGLWLGQLFPPHHRLTFSVCVLPPCGDLYEQGATSIGALVVGIDWFMILLAVPSSPCVFFFSCSELLHSLDMCENDPVAIAQCFVEKVREESWPKEESKTETKLLRAFCLLRATTLKYTHSIAPTIPSKSLERWGNYPYGMC